MFSSLQVNENSNTYATALENGINLYKSNQLEAAILQFKETAKIDSQRPEAYYYCGSCYFLKAKYTISTLKSLVYYQIAISNLNQCINSTSKQEISLPAGILRAKIWRQMYKYDGAIESLNKMIIGFKETNFNHTASLFFQLHLERGLCFYEHAKRSKNPELYRLAADDFALAIMKQQTNNSEQQAELFSYRGHTLLALSLIEKKDEMITNLIDLALKNYDSAISLVSQVADEAKRLQLKSTVFFNLSMEKELITKAICRLPLERQKEILTICLDEKNQTDQSAVKQILWYPRKDSPCSKTKGNLKKMAQQLTKCESADAASKEKTAREYYKRLTIFSELSNSKTVYASSNKIHHELSKINKTDIKLN